MNSVDAKLYITRLLNSADIQMNGSNPWDIQVHDERFYQRVARDTALGLGESYVEKWWDCERVDMLFEKLMRTRLDKKIHLPFRFKMSILLSKLINLQSRLRAKRVAREHYDRGNKLFQAMLDTGMNYSCGYWKNATTLDEAQIEKLDLICRKLALKPGQQVLDIGCGWGGFARYAAERYQVEVTGYTISKEQYDYAKRYCANLPVQLYLQDYRDIHTSFDHIVSIGMFEHVGHRNYREFMRIAHQALRDDGLCLLHTVGSPETYYLPNEWIAKYVFPNSVLPSMAQIADAAEDYFIIEDVQNFGAYYDKTLMAWHNNFVNSWDELKADYDDTFYRLWNYYLLSCAGDFRARSNQLWQFVLSKHGVKGVYMAPR